MSILRQLTRWAFYLFALIVCLLILYFVYRFVKNHFFMVLICVHFIFGLYFSALSIYAFYIANKNDLRDMLLFETMQQAAAGSFLLRLRQLASVVLNAVSIALGGLVFVGLFITGLRIQAKKTDGRVSIAEAGAHGALQGSGDQVAYWNLFFAIVAGACAFLFKADQKILEVFCVVMLVSLLLRYLAYSILIVPIPTQMRRRIGNPYVQFAVFSVCDLVSIIIYTFVAFHLIYSRYPVPQDVLQIVSTLFFVGFVDLAKSAWKGESISYGAVFIVLIGAAYSLVIFKSAIKFNEFKRNDEDFAHLASSYLTLNKFNEALSVLKSVQRQTASSLMLRAVAHCGVMQIEKAWVDTRQSLLLKNDFDVSDPSVEDIFFELRCSSIFYNISDNSLGELLVFAFDKNVKDTHISCAIFDFFGARPSMAIDKFLSPDHIKEHSPFSYAHLLIIKGDYELLRLHVLDFRCSEPLEKIIYLRLVLFTLIMNPATSNEDDCIAFAKWSKSSLPFFTDKIFTKENHTELLISISSVMTILAIARGLGSAYEQSWRYIHDDLNGRLIDAENKLLGRFVNRLMSS